MCIITSLFLGLIVSAEEIIKDRKILKRESFLNLSWFSYLNSKIMIMFLISAIQTISFILAGNLILEIRGMTFPYWIVLFSTSCIANMMGLNISSAFNSVITIYIIIPFLLIPQFLFSGGLLKFDKLNTINHSSAEFVPVIGDMWPARWSFEALAVEQFKNNEYEKLFFDNNMKISQNEWYASYLIPVLKGDLQYCLKYKDTIQDRKKIVDNFKKLNFYIDKLIVLSNFDSIPGSWKVSLNEEKFNSEISKEADKYLNRLSGRFRKLREDATVLNDTISGSLVRRIRKEGRINLINNFENEELKRLVLDKFSLQKKSIETPEKIIRKFEPGYMRPLSNYGRAQFYAPYKLIGNKEIDTLWFNIMVLWFVAVILYISLYFNLLQKIVTYFGTLINTENY
jgi:hypothetical protein